MRKRAARERNIFFIEVRIKWKPIVPNFDSILQIFFMFLFFKGNYEIRYVRIVSATMAIFSGVSVWARDVEISPLP
jgi:hypothetical protein